MPPNKPASPIFAAIEERNAQARELALAEIEALKKDLTALTRILKGQRKPGEFSPFDIVHGAFEIFRSASSILENQTLTANMEQEITRAEARDYLLTHGATLLTQPAGWHWISPVGRMYSLGKESEVENAGRKLARLIEDSRKKPAKAKKASPAAPPAEMSAPVQENTPPSVDNPVRKKGKKAAAKS